MQNSKNPIIIILLILITALLIFIILKPRQVIVNNYGPDTNTVSDAISEPKIKAEVTGNAVDLVSISIIPGQSITDTQIITGSIQGAYFFEGSTSVDLLDANKNKLDTFLVEATGDWMTAGPVSFTTTVNTAGMAHGTAYLRFMKISQKDGSIESYFDVPVVID